MAHPFLHRLKTRVRRWRAPRSRVHFSEIELLRDRLAGIFCRGPRVMVDVGAQFGESFLPFSRSGWNVLAFEPDPDPRKQGPLAAVAGCRVRVIRRALAERASPAANFFTSPISTGISALSPFHETHHLAAQVEVSTLAHELAAAGITRVDFLKIDTEGHDLPVLRGFPWDQRGLIPRVVMCEYEDAKTRPLGYTWSDLAAFLAQKGYTVLISEWEPVVRYGVRHDWLGIRSYPSDAINDRGWGNVIAFCRPADATWFLSAAAAYSRL
jgi:FkbM family methyltransferase